MKPPQRLIAIREIELLCSGGGLGSAVKALCHFSPVSAPGLQINLKTRPFPVPLFPLTA
jgi:hypothetical protein